MSNKQHYLGSFICSSCEMRRVVRAPITPDAPSAMLIDPARWRILREFAAEFDEISHAHRESWDALDFLDWLEPSVVSHERYFTAHGYMPNARRMPKEDPAA